MKKYYFTFYPGKTAKDGTDLTNKYIVVESPNAIGVRNMINNIVNENNSFDWNHVFFEEKHVDDKVLFKRLINKPIQINYQIF